MDLENLDNFRKLDTLDMYGEIHGLPDQLQNAWDIGLTQKLIQGSGYHGIVVAGMGGSAIGADLVAAYIEPLAEIPFVVVRDYELPAWVKGEKILVVASSHSGNTEETLSAYQQARERGCSLMAICTGGQLAELADRDGVPVWRFRHQGQPRAAVGYSFGLLLALLARLGVINDPETELSSAIKAMRQYEVNLLADVPAVKNPAKRQAGQLMDRWVTVFGAGLLAPVARRWKGQVSEIAKAWGQFEFLPEADHNTLAGTLFPVEQLSHMIAIFLRAPSYLERNRKRADLTRQAFMMEGISTDFFDAKGDTRLAQMWTTLHFGDYMAYYLAMAYGVDPTPIAALEQFKAAMKG